MSFSDSDGFEYVPVVNPEPSDNAQIKTEGALRLSQTPSYEGRWMPSALILDISVVGLIRSSSAAPPGP